jgi:hypothetical protein
MIPQNRAWARRVYRRRCKAYATFASAAGLDSPTYAQQMRDKVTNWIVGAEIRLRVPLIVLPSILMTGRIRNQFETGSSRGLAVMGVGLMTPDEERPRYGYLAGSEGAGRR